jgi:hypothetical protein
MANVTPYIEVRRIEIAVCAVTDYFQIVNHEYPDEIYLEKQIVDQFKTKELLKPLTENRYLILNHRFQSRNDSMNSIWEIKMNPPKITEKGDFLAAILSSIEGNTQIDHQKIICCYSGALFP